MEVPQHRLFGQRLFIRESLSDVLAGLCGRAFRQLTDWDPDDLLATPEANVIATLLQAASLHCPTLRRSEAYLLDHTEVDQPSDGGPGGRITEFTLIVPFDGDRRVFDTWAGQPIPTPPIAGIGDNELWLSCQPASQGNELWLSGAPGSHAAAGVKATSIAITQMYQQHSIR